MSNYEVLKTTNPLRVSLIKKLRGIWDHDDYILGILILIETDEEVKKLLEYIEEGMWETTSDILTEAVFIDYERKNN